MLTFFAARPDGSGAAVALDAVLLPAVPRVLLLAAPVGVVGGRGIGREVGGHQHQEQGAGTRGGLHGATESVREDDPPSWVWSRGHSCGGVQALGGVSMLRPWHWHYGRSGRGEGGRREEGRRHPGGREANGDSGAAWRLTDTIFPERAACGGGARGGDGGGGEARAETTWTAEGRMETPPLPGLN